MPLVSLFSLLLVTSSSLLTAHAQAAPSVFAREETAPAEQFVPEFSRNALRDPAYLPAQIGGIVGAYAVSLVLVAITLLSLAKRRREALSAGNDEIDFDVPDFFLPPQLCIVPPDLTLNTDIVPNFSYPSPRKAEFGAESFGEPGSFIHHSPVSSVVSAPGVNLFVDQSVVQADKIMAQNKLEEMFKHVMEHEEAKRKGEVLEQPVYPVPNLEKPADTQSKKTKSKPASLNLSHSGDTEKRQSKAASILSALRSPGFGSRKKAPKGLTISSPMMTPQSATFPRLADPQSMAQSMGTIAPRQYAPTPPPSIPTDQVPLPLVRSSAVPVNYSPESTQSIDERLGAQLGYLQPGRAHSQAYTEPDPESATSTHSRAPLVGLPQSPKPGATFPALPASPRPGSTFTLPASPKPGSTFQRANAPTAVRTGGALPLRAYEPSLNSPSAISTTTKQTTFERKGPLSPMSARTPGTAVPYSPYQPFTPCMPITPSLVTREDRKRMRKMIPKTPTLEMVQSSDEIW